MILSAIIIFAGFIFYLFYTKILTLTQLQILLESITDNLQKASQNIWNALSASRNVILSWLAQYSLQILAAAIIILAVIGAYLKRKPVKEFFKRTKNFAFKHKSSSLITIGLIIFLSAVTYLIQSGIGADWLKYFTEKTIPYVQSLGKNIVSWLGSLADNLTIFAREIWQVINIYWYYTISVIIVITLAITAFILGKKGLFKKIKLWYKEKKFEIKRNKFKQIHQKEIQKKIQNKNFEKQLSKFAKYIKIHRTTFIILSAIVLLIVALGLLFYFNFISFSKIGSGLQSFLNSVANFIKNIQSSVESVWKSFVNFLSNGLNLIGDSLINLGKFIGSAVAKVSRGISNVALNASRTVASFIMNYFYYIIGTILGLIVLTALIILAKKNKWIEKFKSWQKQKKIKTKEANQRLVKIKTKKAALRVKKFKEFIKNHKTLFLILGAILTFCIVLGALFFLGYIDYEQIRASLFQAGVQISDSLQNLKNFLSGSYLVASKKIIQYLVPIFAVILSTIIIILIYIKKEYIKKLFDKLRITIRESSKKQKILLMIILFVGILTLILGFLFYQKIITTEHISNLIENIIVSVQDAWQSIVSAAKNYSAKTWEFIGNFYLYLLVCLAGLSVLLMAYVKRKNLVELFWRLSYNFKELSKKQKIIISLILAIILLAILTYILFYYEILSNEKFGSLFSNAGTKLSEFTTSIVNKVSNLF